MTLLDYQYDVNIDFGQNVTNHYFAFKAFPGDTARQKVEYTRMSIEPDAIYSKSVDSFGNKYIYGSIPEKHSSFRFHVEGKLRTGLEIYEEKTKIEEPSIYLFRNQSEYTVPGNAIKTFHEEVASRYTGSIYQRILGYMNSVHQVFSYEKGVTDVKTNAEQAMEFRKGVCQDYAHVLLSLCRMDKIPVRYVVGMMRGEGASHAWVEALCGGYWYGFDPTNNMLVNDRYIKISHGRDFGDCTLSRGIFTGSGSQIQQVNVRVGECQ
ncbi:MAG: transglutaminase domain-containing protein [Lachnospiraceae bacterium]